MIIVRVQGRLGNQLFQYALYKKLEKCGYEVYLDLTYFMENPQIEYELPQLGLEVNIASKEAVEKLAGKKNLLNRVVRRAGLRHSYVREKDNRFHGYILKRDNVYLSGYWQCDRYFDDIREQIVTSIHYPMDRSDDNKELYQKICSSESVCVTIRRGDYVTNEKNKKKYYICDREYFEKGMKKIIREISNPIFFAFSDDIEWVKENVAFPGEVYYESGNDPTYEKLRLMSACKHFLISNSSFSWWAQYLSQNRDKIVYAPTHWYADGCEADIYQKEWRYV